VLAFDFVARPPLRNKSINEQMNSWAANSIFGHIGPDDYYPATTPLVHNQPTMLAMMHPHPADAAIGFDAAAHMYTVHGAPVPHSCTGLAHKWFPRFDGKAVVDRYYSRWKAADDERYADMIDASRGRVLFI
jgi:hypothetical protein